MSACKACGASIWWARTAHDRRIPVDVVPDPRGVMVLATEQGDVLDAPAIVEARTSGQAYVIVVTDEMVPSAPRWTSHFATCPQADQFRKRDRRGA